MKIHDIIDSDELLGEANLKQAIAAGLIGAASLAGGQAIHKAVKAPVEPTHVVQQQQVSKEEPPKELETLKKDVPNEKGEMDTIANEIASNYNIEQSLATKVVGLAYKYADPVFPTAHDILAVIGVESSFNPAAQSNLKNDPAIGLMQVRPLMWKIDPELLRSSEEAQIKYGTAILKKYFKKLKTKEAAIKAYNVGLTAYRRGQHNPRYLPKVKKELKQIKTIVASL